MPKILHTTFEKIGQHVSEDNKINPQKIEQEMQTISKNMDHIVDFGEIDLAS